jgi:protein involved in polysaccharide export with SLBB domain
LQARSFRSWFLLLLLACAGAVACAGPRPPPASPARSTYRIGAPDHLRIKILPDPAIEQDAVVRPDGMISVDLIGDVQATGRTAGQIAAEIENRIARFKRSASVTVSVLNARTNTVVIYREDGRGAAIELAKETRVAEAIAQAGGYSFLSRRAKVRVIRTDGEATEVLRVNLAAGATSSSSRPTPSRSSATPSRRSCSPSRACWAPPGPPSAPPPSPLPDGRAGPSRPRDSPAASAPRLPTCRLPSFLAHVCAPSQSRSLDPPIHLP